MMVMVGGVRSTAHWNVWNEEFEKGLLSSPWLSGDGQESAYL